MRKVTGLLAVAGASLLIGSSAQAAIVVFDDFNTNEGHFNLQPTFSSGTVGVNTNSTADRITTGTYEGAGAERLVLNDDATAGGAGRVRFLSGGGTPGNNTAFAVGAGSDGWIGLFAKTTTTGWTIQIAIEGPETNSGTPKPLIADGQWHVYEWNLDDETGGANGWGPAAGVFGGDADVQAGNYTVDSIFLHKAAMVATSTIDLDLVARNTEGSLVPEPSSLALLGLAGAAMIRRRRA